MTARLIAYTLILFASWYFNLLGLPDGGGCWRNEPRTGSIGYDSSLVQHRLAHPDVHPLHPLFYDAGGRLPYLSQFGAQGVVMAAVGVSPVFAAGTVAFLTALLVGAVFAAAHRDLGAPVGDVACVLAALAPVFLPFASSLFWVPFVLLAPFALVWCVGPRATTARRRALLVGGVGLGVYLKALCGYEYITTVILAPVAAAWFHQHRGGESVGRRVAAAVVLVGAGLLGFALALGTHVAQVGVVLQTDGAAAIRERVAARTGGALERDLPNWAAAGMSKADYATRCFWEYFGQRALGGPGVLGDFDASLKVVATAAGVFVLIAWGWRKKLPRDAGALALALPVALAAGVSWQVLAVNHMCVHRHLNLIVFAVPFLPLVFVAAGYAVKFVGRRVGVVLLLTVPVLMAVTATDAERRAAADAEEQRAAEAVVAGHQGPLGTGQGVLEQVGPVDAVCPPLLMMWGLYELDAVVAIGWACDEFQRPVPVVAVADGQVVPCRVVRCRRPDVDYLMERPLGRIGFVLVVSSSELAGRRLRVFTAAGELSAPSP